MQNTSAEMSPVARKTNAGGQKSSWNRHWGVPTSLTSRLHPPRRHGSDYCILVLVEPPLLICDCLFVTENVVLISQLTSIFAGRSTIRHLWTRVISVTALPNRGIYVICHIVYRHFRRYFKHIWFMNVNKHYKKYSTSSSATLADRKYSANCYLFAVLLRAIIC